MHSNYLKILQVLICLVIFLFPVNGQVELTPDHPDGVYSAGDRVTWRVQQTGDEPLDSLRYVLKRGGLEVVEHGLISLTDSVAEISYDFTAPGSVLLVVNWGKKDRFTARRVGGAMADPGLLQLSAPRPEDFEQFWEEKINALESIPVNARLERVDSVADGIEYYKITMNNAGGKTIHGQLARPSKGEKFPALLIVQWAGVYPLDASWVKGRAKDGWLVLDISAHDLPIDREQEFYREQSGGDLKNYWAIGNDDRDSSYFLGMYLSCYRAASYLSHRSDWNGETMAVMGDSQGGQQALVTAGLYPGITACMALVPAGFDMLGPEAGRKGGWPQWYEWTEDKDPARVHVTSRYFDVANFVPSIRCPVLVGVGLLDETCPPEGILAGINQYTGLKKVMLLPHSGHQNRQGSQVPFQKMRDEVWIPALKFGGPVPEEAVH
ncbi:MAG: acetylxylan esterase [Bacteroidales bacterium]